MLGNYCVHQGLRPFLINRKHFIVVQMLETCRQGRPRQAKIWIMMFLIRREEQSSLLTEFTPYMEVRLRGTKCLLSHKYIERQSVSTELANTISICLFTLNEDA
ncbi:hypothetical protein CRM22_001140 [Opisthorchis felineus]|uniref:Uncharacterized protein n=1 Tax=Opisthorchis felineus TaxID=147828 RepID=A0A4S2MBX5_OPIFE|nr:hypothetical protein CRM22_001140 [Opisthorchis felineus]